MSKLICYSVIGMIIIGFFTSVSLAQTQEEFITVVGDSLVGKTINGEMIREVYSNVTLTQGNVIITCDKAVQFISRNDAELIGNVVVTQDTLVITTPMGFYYGNERRAFSSSGLKLDDRKVILTADTGDYYFNENRAWFRGTVKLYDTSTTLTSHELTYFKNEDRMIADGNVSIVQTANVIEADTLEHFRNTRTTFANSNVKIISLENNITIYGGHLEDYGMEFHTIINRDPMLIQIDTTYLDTVSSVGVISDSTNPVNRLTPDSTVSNSGVISDRTPLTSNVVSRLDSTGKSFQQSIRLDTLIIRALEMESFRDSNNIFIAKDSVRMVRGDFASKNDHSTYYRSLGRIVTKKVLFDAPQPVLWNELTQLTGDSVNILLMNNQIRNLEVFGNSFLLSQNEIYENRFDQISGQTIIIRFSPEKGGGVSETEVDGAVLSIYYLYEENTGNGLTKSSSQSAMIKFEENKVSEVRLYGFPKSEFYPEQQVEGKELSFTLPGYIFIKDRPVKEKLLFQTVRENQ